MPVIKTSDVALRIGGDDLVPDEITTLLGTSPTLARTKGDQIVGRKTGSVRIARSGIWILQASMCEPENMNDQIRAICSRVTCDLSVWKQITAKYRADLFCGLFLNGREGGFALSAESLRLLAERGIELGVCIYGEDDAGKNFA